MTTGVMTIGVMTVGAMIEIKIAKITNLIIVANLNTTGIKTKIIIGTEIKTDLHVVGLTIVDRFDVLLTYRFNVHKYKNF